MHKLLGSVFCFCYLFAFSQERVIDTVFILDKNLVNNKIQKISRLKEEDFTKNSNSLSDLLRYQSAIYIKENGRGGSSSPAFRGTTASQSQIVWNGIAINSLFLGQVDFNNFSIFDFDEIAIKPGGGSLEYGSSAIGGTIHLQNKTTFNKGFRTKIFTEYGSFNTLQTILNTGFSNEKLSINFATNLTKSENDFEVPKKKFISRNAQYERKSFNFGFGYKLNENNQLQWQTQHYFGNQHFLVFEENQTKTKYLTDNFRSVLGWDFSKNKIENTLKLAYINESYDYFNDIDKPRANGGFGETFLIKNEFSYPFFKNLNLKFLTDYKYEYGEGYQSGIKNPTRNSGSVGFVVNYSLNKNFYQELGIRQDFVEKIESPLLFSYGVYWNPTKFYETKLKFSRNFRYPTFNDLYWNPGGNLDLKPEVSLQIEMGHQFSAKGFKLEFNPFFLDIKEMIRWLPDFSGNWSPVNTPKVYAYGLESMLSYQQKSTNEALLMRISHSYNRSINQSTNQQLSYVPLHKITAGIDYRIAFFKIYAQGLYQGKTYTTTDQSEDYALKPYFILNGGVHFHLSKNINLGFRVDNILNTIYQTMAYYYLPQRNYSINLRINL